MDNEHCRISARWLLPLNGHQKVLENHSVISRNGVIERVLADQDADRVYPQLSTIRLASHALMPGLVNAHSHAAMTLLRGYADDISLQSWLQNHIWPAEQQWVSEEFVRIGTRLAIAEMIAGGVTCFNDMYFFPEVVAEECQSAGIRAAVGLIVLDFPTVWASGPDEYFEKGLALHDGLRHNQLVSTAFAPHAPYTVSDAAIARVARLANELDLPVHIHLHETAEEISTSLARYGVRPLERLSQLGLLDTRLTGVHLTQLLGAEIDSLAEHGATVVHCPESNMKLGSGQCPVSELNDAGVNLALGTDGAASNNDLDMFTEMRSAAMLANLNSRDPGAISAWKVLQMATTGGARALGLDQKIGCLTIGKQADMIAVNFDSPATTPTYDPVSSLVFAAGRDQVSHVWIAGKIVYQQGQYKTIDVTSILAEANHFANQISAWRQRTTEAAIK